MTAPAKAAPMLEEMLADRTLLTEVTPWAGGPSAPKDWDGGAVIFRNGACGVPMNAPDRWTHPFKRPAYRRGEMDIVGYFAALGED